MIKGRKMATLNEYITCIENQDTTLTRISLSGTELNNTDANRLMEALRNAPKIAKNIKRIDLDNNELTHINIPAELIALQELYLEKNQLTSINIPVELIALQELHLDENRLTSINIPAKLTALRSLLLNDNELTSINIPAQLIALQWLRLNNNQLTSINIPATLIALQWLILDENRLTMATKLALSALNITRPNLQITGLENNLAVQLTPKILQKHFEVIMEPVLFTRKMPLSELTISGVLSPHLPAELILLVLDFYGSSIYKLLNAAITMLSYSFNNDYAQLVLTQYLSSKAMTKLRAELTAKQILDISNATPLYQGKPATQSSAPIVVALQAKANYFNRFELNEEEEASASQDSQKRLKPTPQDL
jgi:hypothetical protein